MNEILAILSMIIGSTVIVAVVQYERNISPVEYLDDVTGRVYHYTKIFGKTLKV